MYIMEYPQPISDMLRTFDWDSYIDSQQPIKIREIVNNSIPYLVVKISNNCTELECKSTKIIGFIKESFRDTDTRAANIWFNIQFTINDTGTLTRDMPIQSLTKGSNVYALPEHIHNEMMLVNSFASHIGTFNTNKYQQIFDTIDKLVNLNKTDYLKLTMYYSYDTPLMVLARTEHSAILKYVIKYYSLDELCYRDKHGHTALDYASNNNRNIIKDAIKRQKIMGIVYPSVVANTGLTAENYMDLSEYISGGKKTRHKRKQYKKNPGFPSSKNIKYFVKKHKSYKKRRSQLSVLPSAFL